MNFLFWKRPQALKIQVVHRESTKLMLHEFRADTTLIKGAHAVLTSDFTKLMLQVLQNEHPVGIVFNPSASLEARALHQAKCEGYGMAIANLLAMGVEQKLPQSLEPTFEEESQ